MSLKELTWDKHKKAERMPFARKLIAGKLTPFEYYRYLTNQWYCYVCLEGLMLRNMPTELLPMFRHELILKDMTELEQEHGFQFQSTMVTDSTMRYCTYLYESQKVGDTEKMLAHMYVRHFGDMYGGSIIRNRVPGSGRMYEFDNKEYLITEMRKRLDDSMADEANCCFQFAIDLFEELERV